jgi:SMC interacting uncharacterized protein involved in chromosome segregation
MRKAISPQLLFWFFAIALIACNSKGRFHSQEKQLLQLADSIEVEANALANVPAAEASGAFLWAQENLREFELLLEDEEITVTREEGEIISQVSRARRLLKDNSKRRQSILNSQQRTLLQLRGLAQALGNEATHDSEGTPMDSAYIAVNVSRELQMGRTLKATIEETKSYASRGIKTVEEIQPQSDSLQTQLRGKLARLILERGSIE